MIKWLKARCPVCGQEYEYTEAYKPKTCANFTCVQKYHHNPKVYQDFQNHLDFCRKEARL